MSPSFFQSQAGCPSNSSRRKHTMPPSIPRVERGRVHGRSRSKRRHNTHLLPVLAVERGVRASQADRTHSLPSSCFSNRVRACLSKAGADRRRGWPPRSFWVGKRGRKEEERLKTKLGNLSYWRVGESGWELSDVVAGLEGELRRRRWERTQNCHQIRFTNNTHDSVLTSFSKEQIEKSVRSRRHAWQAADPCCYSCWVKVQCRWW